MRRAEATLLQGIEVGSVFEDQKVFEVIVKGTPETRRSVASVRNLLIDKPDGGHVRLGDVADVRVAQTPAVIKRDAVSRYLDVEADVSGRSVGDVANDIENRLANVEPAARVPRGGAAADDGQGDQLGPHAGVRARLCDRDLPAAAGRLRRLAAGGAGVRHACRSHSWAAWSAALIDGAELSLGSLIGFLALFGIATRSGMLLIRHFQHLEREEGETFGPDLVRRGARRAARADPDDGRRRSRWSRCRSWSWAPGPASRWSTRWRS